MSATDEYLLRCVAAVPKTATILDFGCGDARFLEMLLERGFNAVGVDIPSSREPVERRSEAKPELGIASRVEYARSQDAIPMTDNSVDVIVSNTAFEHLLAIDSLLAEMARVLKPGGSIYTVFPLGSCLIEQHCGLPLFQMIESRRLRLAYLKLAKVLGLYRRKASPEAMECYCYENVFYRRENEILQIFGRHFAVVESDVVRYLQVKAELWQSAGSLPKRLMGGLLMRNARDLEQVVRIRYSAAYRIGDPVKGSNSVESP